MREFVEARGRHDDGLARGGGGLHDAAGAGASDGHRPSLRPGSLGERPQARRMEPGLLPSRRCERHRVRARTPVNDNKGSNATAQYAPPVAAVFADPKKTPEKLLLWFHHVSWDRRWPRVGPVGRVGRTARPWRRSSERRCAAPGPRSRRVVDAERFAQVSAFLAIQEQEAQWWRDACIAYFQSISKRPSAARASRRPAHSLEYYQSLNFPYAPGRG